MGFINDLLQYPSQIVYLEGASNYTWLYFTDGKKELISKPLCYFADRLPHFLRVHKTAVLNPDFVLSWKQPPRRKMTGYVTLRTGVTLPVSRRRWQQVVSASPKTGLIDREQELRSIAVVTDLDQKALLFQQSMEKEFPDCLVNCVQQGSLLSESLNLMEEKQLPKLVILDARSAVMDRLSTLQKLKQHPRQSAIPTLLLVPESGRELVNQGYHRLANSVIITPATASALMQILSKVGQFWLRMAALPTAGFYN